MTIAEPAFLRILIFSSKKRTSGFAIIAMIQPITKGIKYEITDGTTNTTNSKITTAVIRFNTAFTYFLDCLHML